MKIELNHRKRILNERGNDRIWPENKNPFTRYNR